MTDQLTTVTVIATVTFPMGKFDYHKTGSRYDVTNVVREALTEHAFTAAEVRYADDSATCRYCERRIINEGGRWIDPEATGDDSVWRESCDSHDTFTAEHEPTD